QGRRLTPQQRSQTSAGAAAGGEIAVKNAEKRARSARGRRIDNEACFPYRARRRQPLRYSRLRQRRNKSRCASANPSRVESQGSVRRFRCKSKGLRRRSSTSGSFALDRSALAAASDN